MLSDDMLTSLLQEAAAYPLPLRLAALLRLEGITEEQLQQKLMQPRNNTIPTSLKIEIENQFRNLTPGPCSALTRRLQSLARQLLRKSTGGVR